MSTDLSNKAYVRAVILAATALALTGCYTTARNDLYSGELDNKLYKAQADANLEEDRNTRLSRENERIQDRKTQVRRDIERAEARERELSDQLNYATDQLENARLENNLSREEYARLRRELDQLRLDQQLEESNTSGTAEEKAARLQALEARKRALLQAIDGAMDAS